MNEEYNGDVSAIKLTDDSTAKSLFDSVYGGEASKHMEPEQQLMFAVLEEALHCLEKFRGCTNFKQKKLYIDALQWVKSEDEEWVFSFSNICGAMGLDPDYIRKGILAKHS